MATQRFDEILPVVDARVTAVLNWIIANHPEDVPTILQVIAGAEAEAADVEAVMADDARANALNCKLSGWAEKLQAALPPAEEPPAQEPTEPEPEPEPEDDHPGPTGDPE